MNASNEFHELTAEDLAHRWRERTVLEHVDEVPEPDAEDYASPDVALRWLLRSAWVDLREARDSAIGGTWSMKCDWAVQSIIGLTRLVGPVGWGEVPVSLILDGVYERIHERAGTPTPLTDEDRGRAQAVLDRRR
jgi:hypothetical protein